MIPPLLFAIACATTPAVEFEPPISGDASPELLSVPSEVKVPMSARRDAVAGTWTVLITVDEEGDVVAARMEGLTRDDVAAACTRYWSKSTWRPAFKDGETIQWENLLVPCTLSVEH